jgi:hypothetical protein
MNAKEAALKSKSSHESNINHLLGICEGHILEICDKGGYHVFIKTQSYPLNIVNDVSIILMKRGFQVWNEYIYPTPLTSVLSGLNVQWSKK